MLLSIVVPIYNVAEKLTETLESVANELNSKIQLILIDDGSTDSSYKLCKEFESKYKGVLLKKHDNHGVSYSRNYGIKYANGDYILFLDADDKLIKGWRNNIFNMILENRGTDIIYFSKSIVNACLDKEQIIYSILDIPGKKQCDHLASPWSKVFRRDFIQKNGILFNEDITHGEDALFNLEAIIKSRKHTFSSKSIYLYRIT